MEAYCLEDNLGEILGEIPENSRDGNPEGVILSGVAGSYTVRTDDGREYRLRAQGKLRRQRLTPLVGDRVRFQPGQAGQSGWLEAILPRKNQLVRPAVANVDMIALVIAASTPQPDFLLIDRLIMLCALGGVQPLIAVNKCDEDAEAAPRVRGEYARSGAEVLAVSAVTGEGLDALRERLDGRVFSMAGQSGVGKSSLLNALYGLRQETGALSQKIDRGRNTTRHSLLVPVPGGGMALDTPGFSFLDLPLMDPDDMPALMNEFHPYEGQCRFQPCSHRSEPGCAVIDAVRAGAVSRGRWERYGALLDDMRERWRKRYD